MQVETYTAINDFIELFPFVVNALHKIYEWTDTAATDAKILLNAIDSELLIGLMSILMN